MTGARGWVLLAVVALAAWPACCSADRRTLIRQQQQQQPSHRLLQLRPSSPGTPAAAAAAAPDGGGAGTAAPTSTAPAQHQPLRSATGVPHAAVAAVAAAAVGLGEAPRGPARQLAGTQQLRDLKPRKAAAGCPDPRAQLSASGCPCTVHYSGRPEEAADNGTSASSSSSSTEGRRQICPAGLRCSPTAVGAILSAGWVLNSSTTTALSSAGSSLTTERGICVPCQLGEYCPAGTQEETSLTLSACEFQTLSVRGQAVSRNKPLFGTRNPIAQALSNTCSGVKLCPRGSFCPSASEQRPCEAGRYCPEGSIRSRTCNITALLVWNPFKTVGGQQQVILEAIVKNAQPMDGNSCPVNASNPLQGCPPGWFCPTAGEKYPCPMGFFCPGHTDSPVACPILGHCQSDEQSAPDWSWLGVALMFLLLGVVLILLEYVRVSGRCCRSDMTKEDDVVQLIEAVGWKMAGTQGSYQVSKPAHGTNDSHGHGHQHHHHLRGKLHHHAHAIAHASVIHHGRQAVSRAMKSFSDRWWHQEHGQQHAAAAAPAANGGKPAADSEDPPAASGGWRRWFAGRSRQLQPQYGQHQRSVKEVNSWIAPPVFGSVQHKAGPSAPSLLSHTHEDEEEATEDYMINPRLTLVFKDVWVADIPIQEGVLHKARRHLTRLCCPRSRHQLDATCDSSSRGDWSVGGSSVGDKPSCAQQEADFARLEAAAASGAYFIVPGVSSRFAHSEMHAIMGPSGCGKTTLCKALAGRLPTNRICGHVRLLCSTAQDGFTSEVEITAAGMSGAAAAACEISHMTGFVPQFDQLHETLTVLENLQLAAKMRLPVGRSRHSHRQGCCSTQEHRRDREVNKVVGEVIALMALAKVSATVVGSSSDRTLSGGQRKRVAIGVELVSKPSLLWLDEPTSGLDAAVAYDVVSALKASSERGMNVLAVMHQPRSSIFKMFDSCLLLGSNGHVVYSGPQRMALSYMAFLGFGIPPNENTADFLLDVTSGVVPRPGDPDYIPSQLSCMWHKAGDVWVQQQLRKVQQQLRKEQQLQQRHQQQQPQGQQLQQAMTLDAAELLPVAPAVDTPVDWPWRPRDLEALLSRFNLLVDAGQEARRFGRVDASRGGGSSRHESSSVLSYDGFLSFWDESGIKELLGEEQFAEFLEGLCEEFGMKPDACITQAHFVAVLKAQLRAAAAAAAGMSDEQQQQPSQQQQQQRPVSFTAQALRTILSETEGSRAAAAAPTETAGTGAAEGADKQPQAASSGPLLARRSVFADYSNEPLDDAALSFVDAPCAAVLQTCDAALVACEAAAAAAEEAAACEAAADAVMEDDVGPFQRAEAASADAAAAAADNAAAPTAGASAAAAAAAEVLPGQASTPVQLSRQCSSAFSYGEPTVFAQGMLTCPQARLRQHTLRRQLSRRGGQAPVLPPDANLAPAADCLQAMARQQQQPHMQALLRCRKARQAAIAAAAQQVGHRQLSQARMLQSNVSFIAPTPSVRPPCSTLQEARTRCLDELGDFLLVQEAQLAQQCSILQQQQAQLAEQCSLYQQQQQQQQQSGQQEDQVPGLRPQFSTSALQRGGAFASSSIKLPPIPAETDVAASADAGLNGHAQHNGTATAAAAVGGGAGGKGGPLATPAEAAAAALASRQLPSVLKQLQLVILRCSWKAVLSRSALSTDLILTSLLGVALGVAQGRNIVPGSSLMWLVITLLAYGSITLVRSTRSYGSERHIYMQQESPAGLSVTAWVFGHQLLDLVGLMLHPLMFFAWMYVLTLTPVPAWSYYITLEVVGFYTSGLGYLVSLTVAPNNAMIAALAVALLLGGVANGVAPSVWTLEPSHPLLWLNYLSYTRWGLQALYISWLTPAPAARAPATATFLSGLGFCGLDAGLMQALTDRSSEASSSSAQSSGVTFNSSSFGDQPWWNLTSAQRADAMVNVTSQALRDTPPGAARADAAAAAAVTQLWLFYNKPSLLNDECGHAQAVAIVVMGALGVLSRLAVWVLVKWKVARKAQQ